MTLIRCILLTLILTLPASGCTWVNSWLRGEDNRAPPAELTDIENPIPIQRIWETTVGSGAGGSFVKLAPAVEQDRVFAASFDGRLVALNADSGEAIWKNKTGLSISAGVGLSDNLVLVGTSDGLAVAFGREDGKEVWRTQLSSEVLATPRAGEGIVVVRTVDGKLMGLKAQTGERLWTYQYSVPVLTLRGTAPPLLAQDVVISGLDTGRLLVLSLREGVPLFEKSIAPPRGRTELERIVDIDAEPRIIGNVLFIAAYQGNVSAIDLRSGDTLWTRDLSTYAGLDAADGRVYVADARDAVWALDWRNGGSVWKQEVLSGRALSAPVANGDYVVVGDFEGYLHWLAADSGELVGRVEADDEGIVAAPVVSGGILYVFGKGGTLSAFRAGTKTADS